MSGEFCTLLLAAVFFQGPQPAGPSPPESLPLPRKSLQGEITLPEGIEPFVIYHRTSRYEIWQFYAVDRQGRFRPRVIYSPDGPYYLYNGKPYLYAPVRQLDFTPKAD